MNDFNIASFSDLHLGHRRNDTTVMINALNVSLYGDKLLERIDLLVLAGDVFDRLLDLDHPAIHDIDMWIAKLLTQCARHNVVLRVLKGTPSHDREQSQRFVTINEMLSEQPDFRYVDKVEVEYIPRFDAHVLYIPDEFSPTCGETLQVVQATLKAQALEQVDMAIMHGQFRHQLPADIGHLDCHDEEAYLQLVRTLILIGHVHTHTVRGIIVAQGSHDRLKHNEEEAKGYVYTEVKKGVASPYFVENRLARTYKTIPVYDLSMEETFKHLEHVTKGIMPTSHLRIEAGMNHPVFSHFGELTRLYPQFEWDKLAKDKREVVEKHHIDNAFSTWIPVEITRHNITEMLLKRMDQALANEDELLIAQRELALILN